jgi:hypothetical protein
MRLTWSLLAGAVLWLIALEALYLLAYPVCAGASRWPMHAVTATTAAAAMACAAWAWSHRRDVETSDDGHTAGDTPINWIARASAIANIWFALVIVSTEVVILTLRVCF